MTTLERRKRRFSTAFRKEQVVLIESGKTTISEVSRLYEVHYSSVKRWVDRFGSKPIEPTIIISNKSEYDRIGDLEKELTKLKQIIGEQQIRILHQDALIQIAKKELGSDFEKKNAFSALKYLHEHKGEHGIGFTKLYAHFGTSRQAYYQALKRQEAEVAMIKEISALVASYRQHDDRRAGSRSLYHNLDIKGRYAIGVTKFEDLMHKYRLTLAPLNMRIITTTSSLQSWNYKNLTKGLIINDTNQVVVGDITYINIGKEVFYLFCLTDIYSGRIVGHHLGERMKAEDAYQAFEQWIRLRKEAVRGCKRLYSSY